MMKISTILFSITSVTHLPTKIHVWSSHEPVNLFYSVMHVKFRITTERQTNRMRQVSVVYNLLLHQYFQNERCYRLKST